MAQTEKPIYIEIYQPIREQIRAKQQDTNSRFLDVTLLDQGTPFNLINNDIYIYAIKPDNTKVYNKCPVIDPNLGNFRCELTSEMLAAPGCVKAEFVIIGFDGIEVLRTFTFNIDVMEMVYDANAIESTNEFDAVTGALKDINSVRALIRNISDRIGWPWPEDTPQTLFDWFRWLKIYLEITFADLKTTLVNLITTRFNQLHALLGTTSDGAASDSNTLLGRLNYLVSMFANYWTAARSSLLDTTVSSRAPGSTALSNTIWTNARAEAIDEILSQMGTGAGAVKRTLIGRAAPDPYFGIIHPSIAVGTNFFNQNKTLVLVYDSGISYDGMGSVGNTETQQKHWASPQAIGANGILIPFYTIGTDFILVNAYVNFVRSDGSTIYHYLTSDEYFLNQYTVSVYVSFSNTVWNQIMASISSVDLTVTASTAVQYASFSRTNANAPSYFGFQLVEYY